jgi:O-antigen/teichoic acid export membrane protein
MCALDSDTGARSVEQGLGRGALRRGTMWMTAALGGRVVLQALMFLLVAGALGANEFGRFAAALALAMVVAPFASMGTGNVLVMRGAREPTLLGHYWRVSLLTLATTAPVLTCLVLAVGLSLLPGVPATVFLGVCVAELGLNRVVDLSAQAFQAADRMAHMATLVFGAAAVRTSAAALLVLTTTSPTAVDWAAWYVSAGIVSAAAGLAAVRSILRPRGGASGTTRRDLREGAYFALGLSASGVFTDADKALVARLDSFDAAGTYTAGYRVVSFSFVPVLALLQTTYAAFFRAGVDGVRSSWRYARSLHRRAVGYSLAAGVGLVIVAPLLPEILGSDYEPAVNTIRILAPLPLLQTLAYLAGDALMGAGHQKTRALLHWAAAAVSVVCAIALIPAWGATGAAVATLVASVFLVGSHWIAVAARIRKERGA